MHGDWKGGAGIGSARNSEKGCKKTGTHHGGRWDKPEAPKKGLANTDVIYQVQVARATVTVKMSKEMRNDRMCVSER